MWHMRQPLERVGGRCLQKPPAAARTPRRVNVHLPPIAFDGAVGEEGARLQPDDPRRRSNVVTKPPETRTGDANEGGVIDFDGAGVEDVVEQLALNLATWLNHLGDEVHGRVQLEELNTLSKMADDDRDGPQELRTMIHEAPAARIC